MLLLALFVIVGLGVIAAFLRGLRQLDQATSDMLASADLEYSDPEYVAALRTDAPRPASSVRSPSREQDLMDALIGVAPIHAIDRDMAAQLRALRARVGRPSTPCAPSGDV